MAWKPDNWLRFGKGAKAADKTDKTEETTDPVVSPEDDEEEESGESETIATLRQENATLAARVSTLEAENNTLRQQAQVSTQTTLEAAQDAAAAAATTAYGQGTSTLTAALADIAECTTVGEAQRLERTYKASTPASLRPVAARQTTGSNPKNATPKSAKDDEDAAWEKAIENASARMNGPKSK